MPNKNYSRNAEEKLEVVKYAKKHGNAATAKHTDEFNIRYWSNKSSFWPQCQPKNEEPD